MSQHSPGTPPKSTPNPMLHPIDATSVDIVASGHSLPATIVPNEKLESQLGLAPGWIEQRTGVRQRHWVDSNTAVSDLAIAAGRMALERLPDTVRSQIGTVILATSTPDHLLPPTAPRVAAELGLRGTIAFDLAAACTGFVYGLAVGRAMVSTNRASVLLIAANVLSRRIRPGDPATTALFSDAAGAVVLSSATKSPAGSEPAVVRNRSIDTISENGPSTYERLIGEQTAGESSGDEQSDGAVNPTDQPPRALRARVIDVIGASDGTGWDHLWIPAGGSRRPVTVELVQQHQHLMKIDNGMAVFRYAVESMAALGQQILDRHGWTVDDIDVWIPHQANTRIIRSVAERLGLPMDKAVVTLPDHGNSSAASIPVALDAWWRSEGIRDGRAKRVLLTAAGAGLTSGAAILEIL